MKFNESTAWSYNYIARFRPLSKAQTDAIEVALSQSMKATTLEIDVAVARLCGGWRGDNAPGIMDIAGAIRDLRGLSDDIQTPNAVSYYDGTQQRVFTTMSELKGFLNQRPPPDDAWDIICTPIMTDQCRELQRHCDKRGIEYKRFIPDVNRIAAKVADAWSIP